MTNWPESELVKRAFESLDLLVVHEVERSTIARMATHVIATKKQFEIPTTSQYMELAGVFHSRLRLDGTLRSLHTSDYGPAR